MRARSGVRAAVNARLEEISFRAGLTAATIALIAFSAIAVIGVFAFVVSHGGQAAGATNAANASSAPVTTLTTPALVAPRASGHAQANPRPTAQPATQQRVTGTTSPQPTAGGQPQAQTAGSALAVFEARLRAYERLHPIGFGFGPGFGGHGWPGGFGRGGRGRF